MRLLLLISLYFASHFACALDASAVFKKASLSSVVVQTSTAQGSGVVHFVSKTDLTPLTYVLTNCHVVKGASYVNISRLGKSTRGQVIMCDPQRDVALVTIQGELPSPKLRETPLKVGERVFAIGSPRGLELSISEGIISQLRPSPLGTEPLIQTTTPISPGSSGGGLFDSQARLIGITTLTLTDSQGLNFAIPYSYATEAAEENTSQPTVPAHTAPACGWQKSGETHEIVDYIDHCSLAPYGSFKTVWKIYDLKVQKKFHNTLYSSVVRKIIVDCNRKAIGSMYMSLHSENMGKGSVVFSHSTQDNALEFEDAPPGTGNDAIVNAACGTP